MHVSTDPSWPPKTIGLVTGVNQHLNFKVWLPKCVDYCLRNNSGWGEHFRCQDFEPKNFKDPGDQRDARAIHDWAHNKGGGRRFDLPCTCGAKDNADDLTDMMARVKMKPSKRGVSG